jgi:hypothetical protein
VRLLRPHGPRQGEQRQQRETNNGAKDAAFQGVLGLV